MPDPQFPNRPDHPDYWVISQALIDIDAQSELEGAKDIIGRYVNPASVTYAAEQRALRATGPGAPRELRTMVAAVWIDAFLAGARYQHLKTSEAQRFPAEPPAEVLNRPPTREDVRRYPDYFLNSGPGHAIAERTQCPHGYNLTDSCPGCDADEERAGHE